MLSARLERLAGSDPAVQRQLRYWAVGALVYGGCVALLLVEAWRDLAPRGPALVLAAVSVAGLAAFLAATRLGARCGWPAASLVAAQRVYAVACIVAAYALIGPARGLALGILAVVMVFSAFDSSARASYGLAVYTLGLLGATMLLMTRLQPDRYAPADEAVNFAMSGIVLTAAAYLAGRLALLRQRLRLQRAELTAALGRIEQLAAQDELTGLPNRRAMHEQLTRDKTCHDACGQPLALAVIDLDRFKAINDAYGHATGDAVLRGFAQHARAALRSSDRLARWGGEEFLLLLPGAGLAEAQAVLERVRGAVAGLRCEEGDVRLQVSFSAGLALSLPGEPIDAAIARADAALYRAKAAGRDRVLAA